MSAFFVLAALLPARAIGGIPICIWVLLFCCRPIDGSSIQGQGDDVLRFPLLISMRRMTIKRKDSKKCRTRFLSIDATPL